MLSMNAGETTTDRLRRLLKLAWPMVLARSAQAVIGFCDALMTAPLGEDALAAVTTGSMNTFALVIFPMGVVFIVQSFASQLFGQGDLTTARRYAWYGLALAALTGLLAWASIALIEPALGLLAYTPAVHDHMADYLTIRAAAVGAIVATEVLGNWYAGLGNTRLHMTAGLVAMGLNVFLNWVLIYGRLGAPALGVEGAALASVLASWGGLVVPVLVFARDRRGAAGGGRLRLGELWRMLRFGLPNGFNWFLEFSAFALFINLVVADLGTTVLAAMMVVIYINEISFMPAFGLSSAGAILAGQAIGANRLDEVPAVVKLTAGVTATWQGLVGLLYVLVPGLLIQWFAPDDRSGVELAAIGTTLLVMSAGWQLFDAVAMTVGEALRAAGDTAWTLLARVGLAWVVFLPTAFVSVTIFDGGYVAAMGCMILYLALLSGLFTWRFRSGAWRRIDLTGQRGTPQLAE